MPAEELIERVLAGQVEGETAPAPSRPAPHLAQARHCAGEVDADRRVELADVDSEFEGVGGAHRQQLSARQLSLDLATLLRRVAGAVGSDPGGEVGVSVLGQLQLAEALDQL